MKRTPFLSLMSVFLLLLFAGARDARAQEETQYTWGQKLKRGAINIVTSPVEIAREIHNTTERNNLLVGWTVGLVSGLGQGILRFGAGAIDLLTCPFNFPTADKGPFVFPEYVWEKPGPQYV